MTKKDTTPDGNILNAAGLGDGFYDPSRGPGDVPEKRYDDDIPWQYKESSKRSKRYHAEFRDEFSLVGYYGFIITASLLGLVTLIFAITGLINTVRLW